MKRNTHLVAGAISAHSAYPLVGDNFSQAVIFTTSCLLGSLLPDIDHEHSTLGIHVKPLARCFKHRGFTHSILFVSLLSFASTQANGNIKTFLSGLVIGSISHIFIDMFNPKGVDLFYPIKKRFHILPIVKTGKESEIVFILVFIIAYVLIKTF